MGSVRSRLHWPVAQLSERIRNVTTTDADKIFLRNPELSMAQVHRSKVNEVGTAQRPLFFVQLSAAYLICISSCFSLPVTSLKSSSSFTICVACARPTTVIESVYSAMKENAGSSRRKSSSVFPSRYYSHTYNYLFISEDVPSFSNAP